MESHEGLHHLQHALTFLLSLVAGSAAYRLLHVTAVHGTASAKGVARALLAAQNRTDPRGAIAVLFAAGVVVFWHLPTFFNLAVRDDLTHILQHLSFLLAGSGVGFGLHAMNRWVRLGSLVIALLAMVLFASILLVFQPHVYEVYPPEHEFVFAIGMIYAMMPVMIYAVYRFLVAQVS